jgi:drug/metabolite transporter (DMT)-like permease
MAPKASTGPKAAAAAAPAAKDSGVTQAELLHALAQYCVASVVMMLGNKLAVTALPLACTLVIIQTIGTLVLLQLPYCQKQMAPFSIKVAITWLPMAALFSAMMFTSLKCFAYAGVSTILTFRNAGTIATTVVEYFVRGTPVNARIILSEALVLFGAVLYANGAVDFSWLGTLWIAANITAQVSYFVMLKVYFDKRPQLAALSKYSMSRYNNLLAIPFIAVMLVIQGEHTQMATKFAALTPTGVLFIALTCFFGFLISTSGFGLQRIVSATTFIIVNNLVKFANILLGIGLLGEKVTGPYAVTGCLVALLSGVWYSFEQARFNSALSAKAKTK